MIWMIKKIDTIEERNLLKEEDDDSFDEVAEEIRKLKENIKMMKYNSTTIQEGLKASQTIDNWDFGVTMYYLFTNVDQADNI